MPHLIGKNIRDVAILLSSKELNLRILKEKEDQDIPAGIILDQIPRAHQKIRSNQLVFCVISKKPKEITAPHLIGKKSEEIDRLLSEQAIRGKRYAFTSIYPQGYCFSQIPQPDEPVADKTIITYESLGPSSTVIMPHLIGKKVSELKSIIESYQISINTVHVHSIEKNHVCVDCLVCDQKPLAGSLIDSKKNLRLELYVTAKQSSR